MGGFKRFVRESEGAGSTTGSMADNPSKQRDDARKKKQKGIADPVDKS